MLRKKEVYTHITQIPSHIPRQLAVDILHSHGEIITLNPLVLEHKPVKAPRDASADEFYATWYEITERIQYVPGMGKIGSGKISFKGCFHDMPWGLQTHILAPMGVDLRNNWRICGNQPGEPPEARELGVGAPTEGLYLREDIEIKCNITMVSFVKAQMKASSKVLVDRLIKKAELLDAGVLHAMMEEGKLKTFNPADRTYSMNGAPLSPRTQYAMPSRTNSISYTGGYVPNPHAPTPQPRRFSQSPQPQTHAQQPLPSQLQGKEVVAMELPGDYYFPPNMQTQSQGHHSSSTSYLQPPHTPNSRDSFSSGQPSPGMHPADRRWSENYQASLAASSRPTSFSSDGTGGGMKSPGFMSQQGGLGFTAELPTMAETNEEHHRRDHEHPGLAKLRKYQDPPVHEHPALRKDSVGVPEARYRYNPQDYAELASHGQQGHGPPKYSP